MGSYSRKICCVSIGLQFVEVLKDSPDNSCSGHCKKLAPEYASAAATLAKQDPPQYIAKVDATENNALAERFEIKGFPTLIFFR